MSSALDKKYIYDDISTDESEITSDAEGFMNGTICEDFDLRSEYYEKNIEVSKKLLATKQDIVTKVKVHKSNSIVEIDGNQIKDVIKNNKDIKQIVVEKISLEEATRYSLFFSPKLDEEKTSLLAEHSDKLNALNKVESDKKLWKIKDLESLINSAFIENSNVKKLSNTDEFNEGKLKFNHSSPEIKKSFDSIDSTVLDFETNNKVKLKLKNKKSERNELSTVISDDHEKTLKYQKHTLIKKKNSSNKSHYYKAKDHMELYKVGSSYLEDFKAGLKSFSFSSSGIAQDREKTVFGICSFFNYHEDLSICILTSDLIKTFYSNICDDFEEKEIPVFDEDLTLKIYNAKGFDLIQYKDLKKVERKIRNYDFETFIDYLTDRYDLLLWDLPDLSILDSNKELYFPIIRTLDNVSLIVKRDVSKMSETSDMVSYFKRYQVDIKGLLYSSELKRSRRVGNS